jgi:hypothetical protein
MRLIGGRGLGSSHLNLARKEKREKREEKMKKD